MCGYFTWRSPGSNWSHLSLHVREGVRRGPFLPSLLFNLSHEGSEVRLRSGRSWSSGSSIRSRGSGSALGGG